ncbi:MAG: hypothetical protein GTN68_40335 [Candidatus Aminicenantes bacterium]|nr:hypothetical protein [Candidatus Aminicenantes bacterium]
MSRKKFSIILTVSFIMILSVSLYAQVPKLINYQGMLTDAAGNPINGSRIIQFGIYNSASGGTALWTETQTVTVNNGLFNVLLGANTPIAVSVFDGGDKYLAVKVGTDAEMTPRKRLVSVGHAFRAYDTDKVDGKDASAFMQKVDGVPPDATGNVDLVAGSNVTLTPDVAKNQITISAIPGGEGDNLGNHTATQNIKLNRHWLSGDGQDEGVFVANDGNVGIGTTSPITRLDLSGTLNLHSQNDAAVIYFPSSGTLPNLYVRSGTPGNFRERLFVDGPNGNVGIGTTNPQAMLHVNGDAVKPGGGPWGTPSDVRLKKNVKTLEGALDKILQLRGVTFEWKEPEKQGNLTGFQIGMIAQEVEQVFPQWVDTGSDGYKILTIRGFSALAVEAMKELKAENSQLRAENKEIRAENQALQQSNETLKFRMVALEKTAAQLTASMQKLEALLATEINNNAQKNNRLVYLKDK